MEKAKVKSGMNKTKVAEVVEKVKIAPKLSAIQELEVLFNGFLGNRGQELQMFELIGFFELKLVEFKENWRMQTTQRLIRQATQGNGDEDPTPIGERH